MAKHLILLLLLAALVVSASEDDRALHGMARRFELKATATPPAWSQRSDAPLFQVAWLSDLHISNQASLKLNRAALKAVRKLNPTAIFITGDNCALTPKVTALPAGTTLGIRRQLWLKQFLAKEAPGIPKYLIPGDNWYPGFHEVFGSDTYSINIGGFHFVFLTVDASGKANGCSVVDTETIQWLQKDLSNHANMPTLFLQHEPVYPPCYLNAEEVTAMLAAAPQVLGALGGHIHLELQFQRTGLIQWTAPLIGGGHQPAFKLLSFYPDAIIAHTYQWNPEDGAFLPVNKFLQIKIPPQYQVAAAATKHSYGTVMAPKPRRQEAELDQRQQEFRSRLTPYFLRLGVMKFLNP